MKTTVFFLLILSVVLCSCNTYTEDIKTEVIQPVVPVLALKKDNPVLQIVLYKKDVKDYRLEKVHLSLTGTTNPDDIESVSLYGGTKPEPFSPLTLLGTIDKVSSEITFYPDIDISQDTLFLWVSVKLCDNPSLAGKINLSCSGIKTDSGKVKMSTSEAYVGLRVGVALRQHMQDGVNTSRIPGITTSKKGTLLAIYDARRESDKDLQGDMDICLNRSTDGGKSWSPMKVVLDMGEWGGLPERYNGVSDACILSDSNTGDLYIIGLWMHGVLDSKNGQWIEGLNENSSDWNHQWRSFGSQPGYGVKQSSQVMITKSTDDGLTWSEPLNITAQVKKKEWWLLAPAPGHGITLSDGTLVFPSEGRDETGLQFSTITWSKDGGETWNTGNPACYNTNECMAVELSDRSIMLNMRERSNRGLEEGNGRAVVCTSDLGKTWEIHPTSRKALIEPACMAALHKHIYTEDGINKSVLFFMNPNSKIVRDHFTIKVSFDDGKTWPESNWLLLDEFKGNGYSCITSVDDKNIGVLYEGSQADLVYQLIPVADLINLKN